MLNILSDFREWIVICGVIVLTWLAYRVKKSFLKKLEKKRIEGKKSFNLFTLQILSKIFSVLIFLIAFMIILNMLGIDIVPLLTFSGIGAAALGFASKDIIANYFSGVMIYITRPFAINDFIEVPAKQILGTVEEIGWYLTSIRTMQKKTLYIPNFIFSTELMVNHSRMTHRRIEEEIRFRIGKGVCIKDLLKKAREIIAGHAEIDQKEQIDVFLRTIGPYGFVMDIKAYVLTTNYIKFMEIRQDILLKINDAGRDLEMELEKKKPN